MHIHKVPFCNFHYACSLNPGALVASLRHVDDKGSLKLRFPPFLENFGHTPTTIYLRGGRTSLDELERIYWRREEDHFVIRLRVLSKMPPLARVLTHQLLPWIEQFLSILSNHRFPDPLDLRKIGVNHG